MNSLLPAVAGGLAGHRGLPADRPGGPTGGGSGGSLIVGCAGRSAGGPPAGAGAGAGDDPIRAMLGADGDALSTALWLLVAEAGHHRCAGWTFEERDRLLVCACGARLYELRLIDPGPGPGPADPGGCDDLG